MPPSSSTMKTLLYRARTTCCSLIGCGSPQPKTPPLKAPETRKKWFPISKKASIASLKDPPTYIKNPKQSNRLPLLPPQPLLGNRWNTAPP